MTIDAVEYHDDDARHIAVFVQWCARNGMLAPRHAAAAAIADPGRFLEHEFGGKLCETDLTAQGNRFARYAYQGYLKEVAAGRAEFLHEYLDDEYEAMTRR